MFAADTDEEAHRMTWPMRAVFAYAGRSGRIPDIVSVDEASRMLTTAQKDEPSRIVGGRWPRQVAGSPETVRDQLLQMIEQTGATEVMLQSISPDPEARRHSHALVAEALGIKPDVRSATTSAA
ncbi:hypothetical protein [Streptomyces sp. NPDC002588]|uniref:hypothetical protein n=1 Tax=Streptomyces sp. NPDC002588 TaxID=3154419 RepID=UPI00332D8D8A